MAKIKNEGDIAIDMNHEQWELFSKKLISHITLEGFITDAQGKPGKISIEITTVLDGKRNFTNGWTKIVRNDGKAFTPEEEKQNSGVARTYSLVKEKILEKSWYLFGTIQGTTPIPICIIAIPEFNIACYALKRIEETHEHFMPAGISFN